MFRGDAVRIEVEPVPGNRSQSTLTVSSSQVRLSVHVSRWHELSIELSHLHAERETCVSSFTLFSVMRERREEKRRVE